MAETATVAGQNSARKPIGGCGSNGDFGSQFPANPMAAARGTGRGR